MGACVMHARLDKIEARTRARRAEAGRGRAWDVTWRPRAEKRAIELEVDAESSGAGFGECCSRLAAAGTFREAASARE
jgi:hypothetical protein